MMLRPVLVTGPTTKVWSVDEVKAHLRVDGDDENGLIASLLDAATSYLDGYSGILGRCMIDQIWLQSFGCFERHLRLPFPDVSAVVVKYRDTADAEQVVNPTSYQFLDDARGSFLCFRNTFAAPALNRDRLDAVGVSLTAGYGSDPAAVPGALRQAIMVLIAHWYANRAAIDAGTLSKLPLGFDAMVAPFRRGGI